jgi:uroporphyrinogen decarboxylase
MNSKERVLKSINHEEPDRVPYDLAGTTVTSITRNAYVNAMKLKGYSTEYQLPLIDPIQQIVTPAEENLVMLKSDTRRIGAQRIPDYRNDKKNIGNVEMVTDFYGCMWERNTEKDLYFNQVSFPLEKFPTLSECIDNIQYPSWDHYKSILSQDLSRQIKTADSYCCVADRHIAGLTENSLRIRGYEKWYMDTVMDSKGVDYLLEKVLEDKIRYWDFLIDWAVKNDCQDQINVISECDDLGTQSSTIIDPVDLRRMVIPRFKILFNHIKKRLPSIKIFFHSCGAIRELIPDLIATGIDILNPVQYTAAGMGLIGLKKDFGKDLVFWGGGIDTQSVLNGKSLQMIRETVKENIDILAPGGGFIFAPVHNIQDDIPPENFWTMWETLQEYGKY